MITNNERAAIQLSATKKDYYQIWNELLELAGKISDRWDPTSTNESDPGIVLLKVLTALGDKLNYNIDANILEAFMPSAAQAESMRKLCDMMGYNIKYYRSATTKISFAFVGDKPGEWQVYLPMFTAITNTDRDVNYVTIEDKLISNTLPSQSILCMEGQVVRCETENNNIVTINQLDDHNRYYLPENQIAENGIFIYRINDGLRSDRWTKVENLNTQSFKSLVYKFGFDSLKNRPYVQFQDDIGQIIEDGLEIYYIRTSGINGNIAPRVLNTFEKPSEKEWEDFSIEDFNISNNSAAANGSNIETIEQSYDNYKKTIGTFDTLVTCRDYMNAIYNMMTSADIPVVSNVIVSDIRDDINKAATICGFDDYGIKYTDTQIEKDGINTFDLVLYPFKTVFGLNTKEEYKNSFKLDTTASTKQIIENKLHDNKTIAHNIIYPDRDNLACIKNYLKLDAKISTTKKINSIEEAFIIDAIKTALFEQFNARKLDFGEEIPFDSILECIENADNRIKNVALGEPVLYTKFEFADGTEQDLASYEVTELKDQKGTYLNVKYPGKEIYNKLALKNILAGRIELFNYNKQFRYDLSESNYDYKYAIDNPTEELKPYSAIYPDTLNKKIITVKPKCTFKLNDTGSLDKPITLQENELIKFRAPNFKTTVTYPAYVNYFLHLTGTTKDTKYEIPATFKTLRTFMDSTEKWESVSKNIANFKSLETSIYDEATFKTYQKYYGALFTLSETKDPKVINPKVAIKFAKNTVYYCLPINISTFPVWAEWIVSQTYTIKNVTTEHYNGIYRSLGYSFTRPIGYLVDKNHSKYQECTKWHTVDERSALDYYFVQETHSETTETTLDQDKNKVYGHTADGLGKDAEYGGIKKDAEYQLKKGEYLAINYTPAVEGDKTGTEAEAINILYTGPLDDQTKPFGDIIRPNFELIDSKLVNATTGRRYNKTEGFEFKGKLPNLAELPGMYSLSTNEQIEIREFVQVNLTNEITYLYWTLKDEQSTINFINAQSSQLGIPKTYTLQDGEYIYYTDANKTAMAYYGSGTEVLFYNGANFIATDKDKEVSADDIINKGLDVIPWIKFRLGPNEQQGDKKISLKEYQYITLADKDSLNKINLQADNTIDSNWKYVNSATYTLNGVAAALPDILVQGSAWQVKSQLAINMSPIVSQVLSANDSIELLFDDDSSIILAPRLKENNADSEVVNLSIRSNYPYQVATDELNVKTVKFVSDTEQAEVNDFAVKLFESKPIGAVIDNQTLDTNGIHLNNFSNLWTSYFFKNMKSDSDYLQLHVNIPQNHFGLLMINCSNYSGAQDTDKGAYISIHNGITNIAPTIYNYYDKNNTESWWAGKVLGDNHKFILRKGINIIKITKSGILKIHPDKACFESIIFSNLDIIPENNALNTKIINYQAPITEKYLPVDIDEHPNPLQEYIAVKTDSKGSSYTKYTNIIADTFDTNYTWYKKESSNQVSKEAALLKAINLIDVDHKFYYNCPLDASSAIDLNTKLKGTEFEEHLSDAHVWYDKNNINNNFVVSEIDADYLDKGLQIARASKL